MAKRIARYVAVAIALLSVYCGWYFHRPCPIAGTWTGDMTATFNGIYNKHGIAAKGASTTVTFRRNGSFSSEDSATLVAIDGYAKGRKVRYYGENRGTFTFGENKGTLKEVYGKRTIDGHPLRVILPHRVSLVLVNRSTLRVIEDYGDRGRIEYRLTHQ